MVLGVYKRGTNTFLLQGNTGGEPHCGRALEGGRKAKAHKIEKLNKINQSPRKSVGGHGGRKEQKSDAQVFIFSLK